MPKCLSTARNCFTAGGFPSNPIPVRVCAEQLLYVYHIHRPPQNAFCEPLFVDLDPVGFASFQPNVKLNYAFFRKKLMNCPKY
jgi:hypothetical protein